MLCPSCGAQHQEDARFCSKCGAPTGAAAPQMTPSQTLTQGSPAGVIQTPPGARPILWNPNAAANWSLPFSPAFGSILNYLNWKALGEQDRARKGLIWVWVSVGVLILVHVLTALASFAVARALAFLYLVVWYFATGRKQARYVRDTYGSDYTRRPWGKPLLFGTLGFLGFIALTAASTYILFEFFASRDEVPVVPIALGPRPSADRPPWVSIRSFDRHQEVIVVEGGTSVFVSDEPRRCFAYEIPGVWGWGNEAGLIRSLDGSESVGVHLYSPTDLRFVAGSTVFARAATLNQETYQELTGRRISAALEPFNATRFKAMTWTASWVIEPSAKDSLHGRAEKVFLEIAPGWLAQVTVAASSSDLVLRRLIETLGTTSAQDCYWRLLRERYLGLFPER